MDNVSKTAKENFKKWNKALQTRNKEKIALLYAEDATFLPTLSNNFEFGIKGAQNYFEHFLLKNPKGKIIEGKIQKINSECYLHSGFYNFEVNSLVVDKREVVKARFSFIWQKNKNKEWKIIHHHSSLKPK